MSDMSRTENPFLAWHFVQQDRRLRYGDGNTVAAGCVYEVPGPLQLCRWGLHASAMALDAISYAPGPIVCRVKLSGQIIHGDDKSVATRREVLWLVDATGVLHEFACRVAEDALRAASVTDTRAWAAIEAKRKWLAGEIKGADLIAASTAASVSAWGAASDAARDDAWVAASAAARTAAWAVAREAARDAARDAAWNAAWAAARDRYNAILTQMLEEIA